MFETMISHVATLWQILGVAFLASLVVYLSVRSGSGHVLHLVLWRVLFGRRSCKDPDIDRWIADRNAWIQFRLLSGVRARSLAVSKRVIRWAEQHDEETVDVARCRSHFDTERLTLKVPGLWQEIFFAMFMSVFLAGAAMAVAASFSPSAWVSVAVPHAHGLRLSSEGVFVSDTRATLNAATCRSEPTRALVTETGLRAEEVTVVCGWLADPAFSRKADDHLQSQCRALLIVSLLLLGYGWSTLRGFLAARAARAMGRRLQARRRDARRSRRRRARGGGRSAASTAS